jgi:T-complex protein 1 subunit zeta
MIGRAATA